jgi:hypothetical protein
MTVLRRRQEDEADVKIAQEAMAKFTIEKVSSSPSTASL